MHRELLKKSLTQYQKSKFFESSEQKTFENFISFLEAYPDCFERTLEIGHFTASCWLWNLEETACLFTHHRKLGMWLQLGGHADGNSNLLEVALQEAKEESGLIDIEPLTNEILDLSIHEIPEHKGVKSHLHYDVRYQLKVKSCAPLIISEESHDLKWILLDEITEENFDPSILKMKRKLNFSFS